MFETTQVREKMAAFAKYSVEKEKNKERGVAAATNGKNCQEDFFNEVRLKTLEDMTKMKKSVLRAPQIKDIEDIKVKSKNFEDENKIYAKTEQQQQIRLSNTEKEIISNFDRSVASESVDAKPSAELNYEKIAACMESVIPNLGFQATKKEADAQKQLSSENLEHQTTKKEADKYHSSSEKGDSKKKSSDYMNDKIVEDKAKCEGSHHGRKYEHRPDRYSPSSATSSSEDYSSNSVRVSSRESKRSEKTDSHRERSGKEKSPPKKESKIESLKKKLAKELQEADAPRRSSPSTPQDEENCDENNKKSSRKPTVTPFIGKMPFLKKSKQTKPSSYPEIEKASSTKVSYHEPEFSSNAVSEAEERIRKLVSQGLHSLTGKKEQHSAPVNLNEMEINDDDVTDYDQQIILPPSQSPILPPAPPPLPPPLPSMMNPPLPSAPPATKPQVNMGFNSSPNVGSGFNTRQHGSPMRPPVPMSYDATPTNYTNSMNNFSNPPTINYSGPNFSGPQGMCPPAMNFMGPPGPYDGPMCPPYDGGPMRPPFDGGPPHFDGPPMGPPMNFGPQGMCPPPMNFNSMSGQGPSPNMQPPNMDNSHGFGQTHFEASPKLIRANINKSQDTDVNADFSSNANVEPKSTVTAEGSSLQPPGISSSVTALPNKAKGGTEQQPDIVQEGLSLLEFADEEDLNPPGTSP